mmetsp:Transcript_23791/g.70629  ORF Transcript_23791/g.70629 Transcript_23791/m.70629 type:complete len:82 (+) Transcript_23791:398-643(+)
MTATRHAGRRSAGGCGSDSGSGLGRAACAMLLASALLPHAAALSPLLSWLLKAGGLAGEEDQHPALHSMHSLFVLGSADAS